MVSVQVAVATYVPTSCHTTARLGRMSCIPDVPSFSIQSSHAVLGATTHTRITQLVVEDEAFHARSPVQHRRRPLGRGLPVALPRDPATLRVGSPNARQHRHLIVARSRAWKPESRLRMLTMMRALLASCQPCSTTGREPVSTSQSNACQWHCSSGTQKCHPAVLTAGGMWSLRAGLVVPRHSLPSPETHAVAYELISGSSRTGRKHGQRLTHGCYRNLSVYGGPGCFPRQQNR
ncbi:hypothetical protein B0T11DRAFT_290077 [Plectosphaerella cucumerina]|uniref:Uncharacterized protein n=1 Tax=Plectosphaerella cucumerina TaxID=40658 RepID=A0A8K0T6D3_9PEZI|nr:hypothetical protein B0T11DRAFT_290077 [Plectosphaerella cucumerina]